MKTNVKLLAGGIAAMLLPVAAGVAFFVWAEGTGAPAPDANAASADMASADMAAADDAAANDAPIPSPRIAPELATTHRASTTAVPEPATEPAPEIDPHAPELRRSGAIRVRRLVVSTGVRAHEPTGSGDVFELGAQPRIYAFVDAANESGEDVALEVTFEPEDGETAGHVALEIPAGASRFRTWAYTRHVYAAGRWHAVVRGPDGRELGRRAFDVVE